MKRDMINCHELDYDPAFTLPLDQKRVEMLVDNFREDLVTPLTAVRKDGKYYVIEGAHILAAMKTIYAGKPHPVPCIVYPCSNRKEVEVRKQKVNRLAVKLRKEIAKI